MKTLNNVEIIINDDGVYYNYKGTLYNKNEFETKYGLEDIPSTNQTKYIVLVADDSNPTDMICKDICDSEYEAHKVKMKLLKSDAVEYVHVYKSVRVRV